MKKARVLHIITRVDPGGSTVNTLETVARLDPARFEVDLVSGFSAEAVPQVFELERTRGVRCHFMNDLVRDPSPLRDMRALVNLVRYIRRGRYDIVHTHSSKAGVLGRWAACFAGVRLIVHTPHGHIFYGYFSSVVTAVYAAIERVTARLTTRLVALSERGVREHLEWRIGHQDQWTVIPSGIDFSRFVASDEVRGEVRRDFGFAPYETVFVCVARLDPVKNHATLLEAFGRLAGRDPSVRLLLVGDGELLEDIRRRIIQAGLNGRVIMTGFREDTSRLLNAADVFVLASLNEGLGRAALEAMAVGLPLVVSRTGGLAELVREGENGCLVDPGDIDGWERALAAMAADQDHRLKMGAQASRLARDHYSLGTMVRRIEDLYMQLLKGKVFL